MSSVQLIPIASYLCILGKIVTLVVLQDEKSENKKKPKSIKKKSSAIKRKAPRTSPRQQAKRAKLDAGLYDAFTLKSVSIKDFYRPQTKFANVMFSHVSVCTRGSVSVWVGSLPLR